MTHINLNSLPEVVRRFVLDQVGNVDGTVLELDGQPVACLVAAPRRDNGTASDAGEAWTEEKNRQRCELIDRKYDHGLTLSEEAELALLQSAVDQYVDRVAPLPLAAVRQLYQQLLEKAAGSAGDAPP